MKHKLVRVFLIMFVILILPLNISATDTSSRVNEEMTELMRNQLTDKEIEALNDISLYKDPEDKELIDGIPILRYSPIVYWEYFDFPLDTVLEKIEQANSKSDYPYTKMYIVFDEELKLISMDIDKSDLSITELDVRDLPGGSIKNDALFLKDLSSMDTDMTILGVNCKLERIECFASLHEGAVLYFITDNGNFVKYYNSVGSKAKSVVFKEADFQIYSEAYYQYRTDDSTNDNGQTGYYDFLSFFEKEFPNGIPNEDETGENGENSDVGESPSNTSPNTDNQTNNEKNDGNDSPDGLKVWHWVIITVGGISLVALAVGIFVYIRTKRNKKS